MNWLEDKYEITVAAILVVIICACIWLFAHVQHVQEVRAEQEISFEMPRPKSLMTSLFDLVGREIDRQFVNPFARHLSQAPEGKSAPAPVAPPNRVAQALKKSAADKKKKAQLNVDVVDTGRKGGLSASNYSNQNQVQTSEVVYAAPVFAKKETTTGNKGPEKQKDVLSPAQWRALMLAQPTQDNLLKMVSAYQDRELDSNSFYGIVRDLLKTNKAESQTLGLYALRVTPSYASFSELVHSSEVIDANLQTAANQAILSYGTGSYIGVLGVAMAGKDITVALKAMEMVNTNITSLKASLNGKDQTSKDPEIQKLVVQWNSYKSLSATLKQLATGTDQQLAQLASTALAALQG